MDRLGALCRKRMGKTFRKRLGMFNYKVKEYGVKKIKSPGVIPLDVKLKYLRQGDHHSLMKIHDMERNSYYPYGKFSKNGTFQFDPTKTILFDVPDLTGFEVDFFYSEASALCFFQNSQGPKKCAQSDQ